MKRSIASAGRPRNEGDTTSDNHAFAQFPSLGDALAWLDRHVNLEAIERGTAGRQAAPTLLRIAALMDAMGEPQRDCPIVHVTGTNGKGSTTTMIARLLQARGLSVGSYTSPDLELLNERIVVDGDSIGEDELRTCLGSLAALEGFLLDRGDLEVAPTWFELMTAAAYRFFSDRAVDAAVVEVGLGGSYDATNVADGAVAVVTNVDLDHVAILGPTRADIATEKAGIIKPGATVVIGESDPAIVEIFSEQARAVGAQSLWRCGVDFECISSTIAHGGRTVCIRTPYSVYEDVYLPLFGAHQGQNAAVALSAAEAFFSGPLDERIVSETLGSISVPGRLEIVGRRPVVLLDGAHNPAGMSVLARALADDFSVFERIILLVGFLREREPDAMLDALGTDRIAHVVACAPANLRALPAHAVAQAARGAGLDVSVTDGVRDGLEAAIARAREDDLVVVTGSLKVVGEARRAARRLASQRL